MRWALRREDLEHLRDFSDLYCEICIVICKLLQPVMLCVHVTHMQSAG